MFQKEIGYIVSSQCFQKEIVNNIFICCGSLLNSTYYIPEYYNCFIAWWQEFAPNLNRADP